MSCVTTLKEMGLKLTPQRLLIADMLHASKNRLTAKDIVGHVQSRMPGVNKSTIYRTLDILEEAGCVFKTETENEIIYHHSDGGNHCHICCLRCGKTVDCDEEILVSMRKSLARKHGFYANTQHLVIHGICDDCAKSSK